MAASQTSVANSALRILGAKRIASIDAASKSAEILKDAWDDALEEVLELHPWTFAQKRWSIPADVATPAFGWSHQYTLPSDCVSITFVNDEKVGWAVEDGKILTDLSGPIEVKGTYLLTDLLQWSALGRKALAAQLAIECAESITGTDAKVQQAYQIRDDAMGKARTRDGQQDPPRQIVASEWDEARGESGPLRRIPENTGEPL